MKMLVKEWGGKALACALLAGVVGGCGIVYEPQEFSESRFSYGFNGDFDVPIELIPLTFRAARSANADSYTPRSLPAAFAESDGNPNLSIDQRLSESGLNRVDPPVVFERPTAFPPFDGSREVLQPGQRNQNLTPLPTLNLGLNPVQHAGAGAGGTGYGELTEVDSLAVRRALRENPLPRVSAPLYRVGPGDIITLQTRGRALPSLGGISETDGGEISGAQNLLVQDNGDIFIPEIGAVPVSGLTIAEVSQRVRDALVENQIGFDTGIQVTEFGSKRVAVSGVAGNVLLPITVSPVTLGEAITQTGGIGPNPENMIIRVLRNGTIYEMAGDRVMGSSDLSDRILLDGDVVSIGAAYNLELALTYFDQQLRQQSFERTKIDAARADENFAKNETRFEIELENYALQAERLRQEAQIARLESQRTNDQQNEVARIANIEARQSYLDRLRALEQANRDAATQLRAEARTVALANQAERTRARNELRQLLEYELRELELQETAGQRSRTLFAERLRLGAIEQDYVTIAGETRQQTTVALPFEGSMTLTRVLYENGSGVNLTTGDTSEIYVFRPSSLRDVDDRLIAYHLDASNPAALSVASLFEMRPNDVVYVNPQPITTWNRVLTQILPSTGLLQSGINAAGGL